MNDNIGKPLIFMVRNGIIPTKNIGNGKEWRRGNWFWKSRK